MTVSISAWEQVAKAAAGLVHTCIQTNEMMVASQSVIRSRVSTIADAMQNPARGDYAELGRMLPEKVMAFYEAGTALARHWSGVMLETSAEAHHVRSLLWSGNLLQPSVAPALALRTTRYAARLLASGLASGGVGLAPVHAQATANARRLSDGEGHANETAPG